MEEQGISTWRRRDGASRGVHWGSPMDTLTIQLAELFQDHNLSIGSNYPSTGGDLGIPTWRRGLFHNDYSKLHILYQFISWGGGCEDDENMQH